MKECNAIFALGCDDVKPEKLLERVLARCDSAPKASTIVIALDGLSSIYNYRSHGEVVYLATEYDKYMRGKYSWYGLKWGNN